MATPSLRLPSRPRLRGERLRRTFRRGDPTVADSAEPVESEAEVPNPAVSHSMTISEGLGIGFSLLAVLLVCFFGYVVGWSNLQASRDQQRLLSSYTASGEFAAFHGHTPPDGAMVGILTIDSLGLRQAVVEGTTPTDLESGPGLMPATAVPGSRGESVIAGRHGTFGSPFAHLSQLRPGDKISVVDYEGRFHYVVSSVRLLGSGQGLHVRPTEKALLTLVTSRSSYPPSGLVVVTASLSGSPGNPGAATPTSRSELSLGGSTSSLWELLGWAALLVLVLVATVAAYRRAGRPVIVYLLSTPVVLVAALFTFENLTRLLPATM